MFNNIKDIVLIFLVIGMIYLLFSKFISQKPSENFETQTDTIKNAVNEMYRADIDAIRNLADITNTILKNNDTFTFPAGKVIFQGDVEFKNRNTAYINTFPSLTILPYNAEITASNKAPKGWAQCDGRKYYIGDDGYAVHDENNTNPKSITVPNLVGRTLTGAGNTSTFTNTTFGKTGGAEYVVLEEKHIPNHQHHVFSQFNFTQNDMVTASNYPTNEFLGFTTNSMYYQIHGGATVPTLGLTSGTGGNQQHENMPPFYVITWIIKL